MKGRWRAAALAGVLLGALGPLAAAHWAAARAERARALRTAPTAGAYLARVTPAARPGPRADFDVAQLLVHARSLTTLPGWTSRVEVYHGTAPLVDATAPPLAPAELALLRRQDSVRWRAGVALAPLKDKDDRDVVGAVAVRADPTNRWRDWVLSLALPAALLALLFGIRVESQRRFRWYVAAAVVLGVAAYGDAREAARRGTDRWLTETGLLLQEATSRLNLPRGEAGIRELARIARGGDVVAGDSAATVPRRRTVVGEPRAVVTVRLGPGRWVELRTVPAEALSGGWFGLALGLALLGPLAFLLARWGERAAAHPRSLRETAAAWGFLAPAALHLVVFSVGPILFAAYLSVHRWGLSEPTRPFVGLASFLAVVGDRLVWISLRNTALYALYVPISMAIALAVALVLNRSSHVARLVRTAFFLPCVSSVVAIAIVWQWMFHADLGVVNYALSFLGLGPSDWLGNPRTALVAVMVVSIWVQVGYQMMVYLGGLQAIPCVYLDAARADGASAWQRFWRITFPLLRPVTLFLLVTGVIGAFQVFTYVYVLTGGGPLHATDVVAYRLYQTAWGFLQFGSASVLSLLVFVLLFGFTWTQFKLAARRVEYA